jgi:hypothetical protein
LGKANNLKISKEKTIVAVAPKKTGKRVLTGKELKVAAIKRLQVYYIEKYYNKLERHLNFKGTCNLEKSIKGFYVNNSIIDPNKYKDNDPVCGEFFGGYFEVCALAKIKYI